MPAVAKFLEPLSAADRAQVMSAAAPWEAPAEQVLYRVGQMPAGVWLLDEGITRYEASPSEHHEVVLGFSVPGACFGEGELLEGRPSQVSAVTCTPCRGWTISAVALDETLGEVPAFARLLLEKLARNVRTVMMLYRTALSLAEHHRLALALLNLAQPVAQADRSQRWIVPFTQEMLGKATGTSRQLVSKYLRQWAALGWIEPRYRELHILDFGGLKSIFPPHSDPLLFSLLARRGSASLTPGS